MAKKKSYPANLLHALKFNQCMGSDLNYENLNKDQMLAITHLLEVHLTAREHRIVNMYYLQGMSRTEIAEEYEIPENRVRQIIEKAFRKLRKKEWLIYILEGYETHLNNLREQLKIEEEKYCSHMGINSSSHLFYQSVDSLNVSKKVLYSLKKGGYKTVRDVMISLGMVSVNRRYGEVAAFRISEDLKNKKLLPESYEPIKWKIGTPLPDIEVAVFHHINSFFPE